MFDVDQARREREKKFISNLKIRHHHETTRDITKRFSLRTGPLASVGVLISEPLEKIAINDGEENEVKVHDRHQKLSHWCYQDDEWLLFLPYCSTSFLCSPLHVYALNLIVADINESLNQLFSCCHNLIEASTHKTVDAKKPRARKEH